MDSVVLVVMSSWWGWFGRCLGGVGRRGWGGDLAALEEEDGHLAKEEVDEMPEYLVH